MFLRERKTIWGIPIVHLKEYSKKYKFWALLLLVLDVIVIFSITSFLYYNNLSYETYGFTIVGTCLAFHFIFYNVLSVEKWEAFKFYNNFKDFKVVQKSYKVNTINLYSVLYCTGYKRLKQNKTFEEYKEQLCNACCESTFYAKDIMKYLKKYEDESGNLTCFIITKGKKAYFVDFMSNTDESDFNKEKESEDGTVDNSGTVENISS
jgi:hypothetical protein